MYQVLLVDDEPVILRNISKVIDWEKFGFSVCATAECGEEACRLLKEHKPSLVITDVMMPQMNGIELAELIGENYPKTEVIIISGYDEFDFARSAMRAEINFFNSFVDKGLKERLEHVASSDFGRVSYTEAVELLKQNNDKFDYKVEWGTDLQTEHERYLTEQIFKKPVFVTDYPKDIKAFYMRLNDDGKTVAACDCLVPGIGEIIGGSQRAGAAYH